MILTKDERKQVYQDWLNSETLTDEDGLIQLAETALLEKLRGGVELPEPFGLFCGVRHDPPKTKEFWGMLNGNAAQETKCDIFTRDQLLQYGAAQRLAAREQQWLPIESAPQGTMILCANMKAREAKGWCFVAWVVDGKVCGHRMDMPTHWQPLPPTPASPQEQQP